MNEKEKARELVREYLIAVYDDGQPFDKMLHLHKTEVKVPAIQRAKQCALIAVDLMLNEYKELNERPEKLNHFVKRPEYWQTVRTEIEKL